MSAARSGVKMRAPEAAAAGRLESVRFDKNRTCPQEVIHESTCNMDSLDLSTRTRLCGVCESLDIDQISRPDIPESRSRYSFRGHKYHQSLEALQESASLGSCDLCGMISQELMRRYTVKEIRRHAQTPVSIRLTSRQAPFGPWRKGDRGDRRCGFTAAGFNISTAAGSRKSPFSWMFVSLVPRRNGRLLCCE